MPLDETLSVMRTLDEIRAQWGLTYPMEDKHSCFATYKRSVQSTTSPRLPFATLLTLGTGLKTAKLHATQVFSSYGRTTSSTKLLDPKVDLM